MLRGVGGMLCDVSHMGHRVLELPREVGYIFAPHFAHFAARKILFSITIAFELAFKAVCIFAPPVIN